MLCDTTILLQVSQRYDVRFKNHPTPSAIPSLLLLKNLCKPQVIPSVPPSQRISHSIPSTKSTRQQSQSWITSNQPVDRAFPLPASWHVPKDNSCKPLVWDVRYRPASHQDHQRRGAPTVSASLQVPEDNPREPQGRPASQDHQRKDPSTVPADQVDPHSLPYYLYINICPSTSTKTGKKQYNFCLSIIKSTLFQNNFFLPKKFNNIKIKQYF